MKPVEYFYQDKSRWKFDPEKHAVKNDEPSLTVQGEALSIQQLFQRAAAGMDLSLQGDAHYLDEALEDIDSMYNPSNYDLSDRMMLQNRINQLKQKVDDDILAFTKAQNEKQDEPEPEPETQSEVE